MSYNTKVTKNNIHAPIIFKAGYCELYYLLHGAGLERDGYNSGIYGWNYDVYYISQAAITTGYRNMPGYRLKNAAAYEEQAKAICNDWAIDSDTRRNECRRLLIELINDQG